MEAVINGHRDTVLALINANADVDDNDDVSIY
jgi:hypothetical protein